MFACPDTEIGQGRLSGHGDADYYVHAAFRDAVRDGVPLEFDVYRAMDTMAPAALAVVSIERGGEVMTVPDFRPGPDRKPGQMPADIGPLPAPTGWVSLGK